MEKQLKVELSRTKRPVDAASKWQRLTDAIKNAQSVIPDAKPSKAHKLETSDTIMKLIQKRSKQWNTLNLNERKIMHKKISRSVRNDYRIHVERIIGDIEKAEIVW